MAGDGRNLVYYAEICLQGVRKGMKNLSQIVGFSGDIRASIVK